ncbi:MAG: hypothetical protein FWE21_10265 [Defluviitaleaceae bacterium]|nr:hypothetical protein [Defluviitaleaceae bacterium]
MISFENRPILIWDCTSNYRLLADHDTKHTFDVDKYLSSRLKLRKDDVYVVAEIVCYTFHTKK